MKIMWCMIPKTWSATYRNFSHFGPNSPDNQNYEKMKKTPGDIIILHKCIINDNCMIYGSWDTKCNRQNFFVIRDHFLPFYLSNSLKNPNIKKKEKKKKKSLVISSFYTSVPKFMIIGYTVSEIWHVTDVIIFHFGLYFSLLPPNSPKNEKFKTMK